MIAYVLAAALVADEHLMSASGAPGNAVQEESAVARRASGLDAHVLGPVISDDGADFFIGRPVNVGGVSVFDDDPPFIHGPRRLGF